MSENAKEETEIGSFAVASDAVAVVVAEQAPLF